MATTTTEINLPDIQATPDQRSTAIAAVGIRGLELPLQLDAGDSRLQTTLGTWDLAVSLAEGVRGTHMSRFVELASRFSADDSVAVSRESLEQFSADLLDRLEAEDGRVRIKGRFLLSRSSPVTEIDLPVPFDFAWKLRARRVDRKVHTKLVTEVGVLATSAQQAACLEPGCTGGSKLCCVCGYRLGTPVAPLYGPAPLQQLSAPATESKRPKVVLHCDERSRYCARCLVASTLSALLMIY